MPQNQKQIKECLNHACEARTGWMEKEVQGNQVVWQHFSATGERLETEPAKNGVINGSKLCRECGMKINDCIAGKEKG